MGVVLAVVIWGIAALSMLFLAQGVGWMPATLSVAAERIDAEFFRTLWVTGIAFVLVQVCLGWFILRYRDRGRGKATYIHGHNGVEIGGVITTGVTFVT
ncbi:MAG: hypothetical protein ACE5IK_03595, partial [Acidobacteriota bacterium]